MAWSSKNRTLFVAVIIAAVIALAASYSARSEVTVRAEKVDRASISSTISTNGKVEPSNNFQSRAAGPALVTRVLVREGDHVKKGQLLVQLDEAEALAQMARAKTQLRAAEADLAATSKGGTQEEVLTNRANLAKEKTELDAAQRNFAALRKLKETGAASQGEVDDAQNRLTRAQAEMALLQQKLTARFSSPELAKVRAQLYEAKAASLAAEDILRHTNIHSPWDGIVYSVPVRDGAFVNSGDLLVQLADLVKMQVHAFVDEPEIGKLRVGQKVSVNWDALPGRTWTGVVSHTPTTVVPRGTRSVGEVVCDVDNSDLKLLPNINVTVAITLTQQQDALTVSREAVVQDGAKEYVFVVEGGHLHRTEVQTSISNLTRVAVTQGLHDGQMVALGSANNQPLSDGASVKVEHP